MTSNPPLSRREFLFSSAALLLSGCATGVESGRGHAEPVIDIHQHTNYHGRTNAQLIAHQQAMGVTHTILLPAGRFYGLDAGCGGNQTVEELARENPRQFHFFANEVPDLPGAGQEIEHYLNRGAIGIGEQKFRVDCDSPDIEGIAEIAQSHRVPVLLHFQHGVYNTHLERFHKILKKYPKVHFIGHAQTWWGNIDKHHDQTVMYPKGKVTPGGITDRLLTEYPNMYGDCSAGSGLNALTRDEAFTREFLKRHQHQLVFGSDCADTAGQGTGCDGAQILDAIRRLAPDKKAERRILHANAARLLRLENHKPS